MTLPTTTELLMAWDAARERSQQSEIGMSQLGACERQTGYRLAGEPPDEDYDDGKIQAILGSAIHQAAAFGAVLALPNSHPETLTVEFCGLTGHPDLYYEGTVRDIKTIGYTMQLERIRAEGARLRDRWQAHTYGAGLWQSGREVHTVEIDYICRDSGEEYLFSEPWSMDLVRDAMTWLARVRSAEIMTLNRDFRPGSAVCRSCEFFRRCWNAEPGKDPRSVLYWEHQEPSEWALRLEDAQERRSKAEADEADAKGALDALRTVRSPGEREDVFVRSDPDDPDARIVTFHVKHGRRSFDKAQIAMDYKRAGARPPEIRGEPTISVKVRKRERGSEDSAARST